MASATALLTRTRRSLLYPHAQWYFLLAMGITWLGFSRTYFVVVQTEPLLHHVHGALMGGWIALLVMQPILYQRGKLQLHRTLGRCGVYLLVPAIVGCGFLMVKRMIQMQDAPPSVLDQLAFLDLTSLIVFPALVILSIYHARNLDLHARYIVCTVLLLMPPALTRALFMVPSMRSFQANVNTAEALVETVLLVMILGDKRRGKIWVPYSIGLLGFCRDDHGFKLRKGLGMVASALWMDRWWIYLGSSGADSVTSNTAGDRGRVHARSAVETRGHTI